MNNNKHIYLKASFKGAFFVLFILSFQAIRAQEATVDSLLSRSNRWLQKEGDSALIYAEDALKLARNQGNVIYQVKALAQIGDYFQNTSQLEKASEFYLESIQLAEAKGQTSLAAKPYNGLGMIAYERGEVDQALEFLNKSAFLKKEAGELEHYAMILTNISAIYFSKGDYQKALEILLSAQKDLPENNEARATLYNSIGGIYQAGQNNLDSAIYFYQKSIELSEKNGFDKVLLSAYTNLGDVLVGKGENEKGLDMMRKALKKSQALQRHFHTQQIAATVAAVYEKLGDTGQALFYKKIEIEAKEFLFDQQKNESIAKLQLQFETQKKESEIQQLRSKWLVTILVGVGLFAMISLIFLLFLQKRKAKRELENAKNTLLQNLIHDIRTPVTLITGPVKWYKQSGDIHRLTGQLDLMEKSADRLEGMITDLLNVSKLDAGKYQTEYSLGNPIDVVKDICTSFLPLADLNDQRLILDLPEQSNNVWFSSKLLASAMHNLLSNAIKYAGSGCAIEVHMTIEAERLKVNVRDHGKGLEHAQQKQLFQRYFRGSNAKNVRGTGLGLSMIRELLLASGGTMDVIPVTKGFSIDFSLPLARYKTIEVAKEVEEKPLLLILEDDADLASFVASIFAEEYDLVMGHNAEQAWELLSERVPDIVLSDIMLMGDSGMDFLKRLKADSLLQHIPIVLFSALNSNAVKQEALRCGAAAFIAKPFDPLELQAQINRIFGDVQALRNRFKASVVESKSLDDKLLLRDPFLQKATAIILSHLDEEDFNSERLAEALSISRSQLHRKITALSGDSTSHFIRVTRLEKSRDFLQEKKYSIKEIAYMVGFSSPSYFSKSYKEHFGVSPGEDVDFQ